MLKASADDSYLCVCDGKIEVTRINQSIMANRGDDITVEDSTKKLAVSSANTQMWKMV